MGSNRPEPGRAVIEDLARAMLVMGLLDDTTPGPEPAGAPPEEAGAPGSPPGGTG